MQTTLHAQEAWSKAETLALASATTNGEIPLEVAKASDPLVSNGGDQIHPSEGGAGEEVSPIPKRFQYGFQVNFRGVYDDNIFLVDDAFAPRGDFYFAIEPSLTIGYGDVVGHERNYVRFDYVPSIFLYADYSRANAFQHLIRLEGDYSLGQLNLRLSQNVELLDGSNPTSLGSTTTPNSAPGIHLDPGGTTKVNNYTTDAGFSYDLTGKTFLSGGLHFALRDYQNLIDSTDFSGELSINYTYSPKLTLGFGGTAGYNSVEGGSPDQIFEHLTGRLSYQLTGKISLTASGGVEFRQFEGESRGTYVSPIYELSLNYQPFDGTTFAIRGSRQTQNSAVLAGQDYASTNLSASVRQRLFRRFYLGLSAGYENSSYFNTLNGISATREDNYYFVQPGVDVTLTRFWTAGAYYLHRESSSNSLGFSFHDNQYGIRTSLNF